MDLNATIVKTRALNGTIIRAAGGGGGSVTVDDALSDSSTNPVQNKVIKTALDAKGTYSKPSGGIPASDLASGVVPDISAYRTSAAQDVIDAGKADKVTEVTVSTAGAVSQALDAGKIYHFTGALTALTITLNAAGSGQLAQYHFDFTMPSTAFTPALTGVTMPDGHTWAASKRYEVDILNGYGAVVAWAVS